MIIIYNSTYFTLDAKSSKDFNLIITTLEDTYKIKMGQSFDYQLSTSGNGRVTGFNKSIKNAESRQMMLSLVNIDTYQPISIDLDWQMRVTEWLLGDSDEGKFREIYFDEYFDLDLCQYIAITNVEWNSFYNGKGYIIVTYQPLDDLLYTRPIWQSFNAINDTNLFEIENTSNVGSMYPYMEIEPQSDTVKITNYNTGSYIEFKNIPTDKTLKLRVWNNEKIMMPSYISYDYDNFNGVWLELQKGINTIQVDGACVIDMQLQFPIMI